MCLSALFVEIFCKKITTSHPTSLEAKMGEGGLRSLLFHEDYKVSVPAHLPNASASTSNRNVSGQFSDWSHPGMPGGFQNTFVVSPTFR